MYTIEIINLTRAEASNLEKSVGKENASIKPRTYNSNEFGAIDPVSVALIIGKLTIAAVALWLKSNRKKQIVIERKKKTADGLESSEITTIEIPVGASEKEIESKILDELNSII